MFESTDRYLVRGVIGEGSHGVVYEAVDRENGAEIALKTLRTLSPDALFQFKQEFRSIQNLNHPNLVELFDLATSQGTWFFTMQRVQGVTFLDYVRPDSLPTSRGDTTTGPDSSTRLAVANLPETLPSAPQPLSALEATVTGPIAYAGGRLDLPRLEACLVQLTRGLIALHSAGKVHRDVKPNNMLVTADGHLVILDFGLTQEIRARSNQDGEIAGTVAYMSPEQAAGRSVTPAADWYAVGVMLFEALTGRLPFFGNPMRVLMDKQTQAVPDPRKVVPDLPKDLAELAMALLAVEPGDRPSGAQVLERLRAGPTVEPILTTSGGTVFVGREDELETLTQAMREAALHPRIVCVAGRSGMGKTMLVKQFIRGMERRTDAPLFLEGACYQRESVPYKGIDAALDGLASALSVADQEWVKDCLPPHAGLLCQFFPVLSRCSPLADAARKSGPRVATDPSALRQQLFATLRQFLKSLSRTRPLVLVLDDIQWAGDDTWALLRELLRGDDAPRLLLLTLARLEEDGTEERLRQRHTQLRGTEATWIELAPLSRDEGRELARQLLRRVGAPTDWAEQVVRESQGHPLLLDALARTGLGGTERTLDEMLLTRVHSLEPVAQRILEFCSLSNTPIVQQAIARAVELDFGRFSSLVGSLKIARLVQASGGRALDTVQPFHDRVRVAVRGSLDDTRQLEMQLKLALALESIAIPDSEALAWHWEQAGDSVRAAKHAERAGTQAMDRLAFERAAHFFQQAVDVHPTDSALLVRLGEALVGAGRGAEAGAIFERASTHAPALEGLELTRRAAHELLRAGQLERGLLLLRDVLRASGAGPIPSRIGAVVSLLVDRFLLFVRGLRFKERPARQLPASTLLQVDATWSVAEVLSMLDVVGGAAMQIRNLRLALGSGEPLRVARALAMQAGVVASGGSGSLQAARAMHQQASELSSRLGDRPTAALVQAIDGIIDFLTGQVERAMPRLAEAARALQVESRGTRFELTNTQLFLLVAQFYQGALKDFVRRVPELLDEGYRRGDRYAVTNFSVNHCNAYWLTRDEPKLALEHVDEALSRWSSPGYQTMNYYALLARAQVALYEGRAADAANMVKAEWPQLKRSFLLTAQMLRLEALHLKARTSLAVGDLDEVKKLEKQLKSEKHPLADGLALALAIGRGEGKGWDEAAWEQAESTLRTGQVRLLVWAARHVRHRGGDAEAWFGEQGVQKPSAFVRVLLPTAPG